MSYVNVSHTSYVGHIHHLHMHHAAMLAMIMCHDPEVASSIPTISVSHVSVRHDPKVVSSIPTIRIIHAIRTPCIRRLRVAHATPMMCR